MKKGQFHVNQVNIIKLVYYYTIQLLLKKKIDITYGLEQQSLISWPFSAESKVYMSVNLSYLYVYIIGK